MNYGTWTIFVISCISITPLPSTSYIRNAHFSFSSGVPLDVTSIASRNSCNKRWYPASVTSSQLRDIKTFIFSLQRNLAFVWNENLFSKVYVGSSARLKPSHVMSCFVNFSPHAQCHSSALTYEKKALVIIIKFHIKFLSFIRTIRW